MELASFSVGNITMFAPNTLVGEVHLQFKHEIDGKEVADLVTIKIRAAQSGDATLQALEAKLLQKAADRLTQAARLVSQETVESLRQQTAEYDRKQDEQSAAALAAVFQKGA
jgi:hypothetical protein